MKKQFLLFLFALLPMLAMADASGSCGTNVTYTFDSSTGTLTIQGNGAMTNYSDYMYSSWYSNIKTVIIEDGVTSIVEWAFFECSGLTSVTIPNSVTNIGSGAFSGCSGLTSIIIPNSVTSIGGNAFYKCSGLTSVTIPNSVTSIEGAAFADCSGLTSITVAQGNTKYDSRDNCNAIIESASNRLISGCKTTIIPNTVTSIGNYAFCGCSGLTSVTIPNSVTSIGESAFRICSGLTVVTIPNSVTAIYGDAFNSCSGLTSITIPNSVTNIGSGAFSGCSGLISINVVSGNTKYDSRDNCNAIIESASNTLIAGCKTTIIPNTVTSIGNYAFYGCSGLTSVTIPNSVTSIGYSAFSDCSGLTSVTIPNSVTSIGRGAFKNCSGLTSVTIGNSVTSIGSHAFNGCSGLTSVTIPNSVTSIGNYAFYGCSGLTSVISKIETPFTFGSNAFKNVSSTCVLTVPEGTRDAYIAAGWTENVFKGGVVESENVTIAMETGSGADRTMIGYSSQYNLDFTGINDVKAYLAIGFTDTKSVLMARVYVVPANTGIVLKSDVAGVEVEVPTTTSDVYYANLLKPAVNNVTIKPNEDIDDVNYTNLMVGTLNKIGRASCRERV